MSILRHVANVCLGAACLMGLGFSLDLDEAHVLLSSMSSDEAPAPNLGDCLHNVDRSYWPRTYAAICKDIRAGIAAELAPIPAAATPLTRPPLHETPMSAPARPTPVSRNSVSTNVESAVPRQSVEPHSCSISETGMLTLRRRGTVQHRSAHFPGVTATAQSTGGLALGVPPDCDLESPTAGRVLFAGEFKGYKSVLILGIAGGHRLVIAGLGTLAVKRGDAVARGQILAASSADPAPALATAFGGEAASLIYFDMRNRDGSAEALPWFSAAS